jgi:DNA-binding beta-propeller fold protein YncE
LADIKVGAQPLGIAFSGGYVWVVNRQDRSISRIDPQTNAILSTQGGLTGPCNLASDPDGGVWVTNCLAPPYVVAHLSRGGEREETVEMPDVPAGVAFGAGDVWVALLPPAHPRGTVVRVDPTSARIVHPFRVGRGAEYMDFDQGAFPGEGTLWVGNVDDDTVSRSTLATTSWRLPSPSAARPSRSL